MKSAKSNLLLALLSVAFLAGGLCFAADPARPNILFFTADDLEWDSPGAFGCPILDITPNIDKLASQGMRFTQAYSTVAVCQPVRATMHTGMVPSPGPGRTGLHLRLPLTCSRIGPRRRPPVIPWLCRQPRAIP